MASRVEAEPRVVRDGRVARRDRIEAGPLGCDAPESFDAPPRHPRR